MRRETAKLGQPAAGSWTYRARRLFRGRLEEVGLFGVLRWAALLLLVAVLSTYVVAWAHCLLIPNQSTGPLTVSGGFVDGPLDIATVTGPSPGVERIWWSDTYGWPFRSVGALSVQENRAGGSQGPIKLRCGIDLGSTRTMHGTAVAWALPLVPINGLFALDVLFFFVIASWLSLEWIVRRDRRRLLQSRCIQCAYPMAGAARCAECGWERGKG